MPAVLPAISLVGTLAGAGMSFYGQRQAAKAQEKMGEYNAQVAENAAKSEAEAGAENAKRKREQNQRVLSGMRARMAAGGANAGTGSSLDVLGDSASELELQALDMFRDSDARTRQHGAQAEMSRYNGQQASAASNYAAMGSLISGVGSAASGYANASYAGAFGGSKRTSVTRVAGTR